MDRFGLLQDELVVSILELIGENYDEVQPCRLVCKRWNRLCMEQLPSLQLDCSKFKTKMPIGEARRCIVESEISRIVSWRRKVLKSLIILDGGSSIRHSELVPREGTTVLILAGISAIVETINMDIVELSPALVDVLLECKQLKHLILEYDKVPPKLDISGTWPRLTKLVLGQYGTSLSNGTLGEMLKACPGLLELSVSDSVGSFFKIESSCLKKLSWSSTSDEVELRIEAGSLEKFVVIESSNAVKLSGVQTLEVVSLYYHSDLRSASLRKISCLYLSKRNGHDEVHIKAMNCLKNVQIEKLIMVGFSNLSKVVPLLAHCKTLEYPGSQDDLVDLLTRFGERCPLLTSVRVTLPSKRVLHLEIHKNSRRILVSY